VRVLSRDVVGVVIIAGQGRHELAVWPSARLQVDESDLQHLTPFDACARSHTSTTDANLVRAAALNRCQARARDGRCQWCGRELESREEQEDEHADP
jgi:hypothetical protein